MFPPTESPATARRHASDVHGGGWILGNAGTHDREYDRSPEAQYPVAIEQAYATARWITDTGQAHGLGLPGRESR
jgi:hypothetical protein